MEYSTQLGVLNQGFGSGCQFAMHLLAFVLHWILDACMLDRIKLDITASSLERNNVTYETTKTIIGFGSLVPISAGNKEQ